MTLINTIRQSSLRVWVGIIIFAGQRAAADEGPASPLQVIMDGRDEAANSRLTEEGIVEMSQQSVNIILYVCGAAGIILTALGIYQLWYGQSVDMGGAAASGYNKRGLLMIAFGGLLTIAAVISAVVPYAVLGLEG